MKVRVTLELELPEVKDPNVDLTAEYVKGINWEMAHVIQDIFDNFLNFSVCGHLERAMQFMGRKKGETDAEKMVAEHIVKHSNAWADILRNAEQSMKVEKIS